MDDTKARLLRATIETLAEAGLAAATARTIAQRANANQSLVFYHFGSVTGLVAAAAKAAVEESVERHRPTLAQTRTLSDLLAVGRRLNEIERATGNTAVMAQVLAGGQHDPELAVAGRYGMSLWRTEIHTALDRVLAGSAFAGILDVDGLAGAVAAGFIGIELYEGVDADAAATALAPLDDLARLLDAVDGLGPMATAALGPGLRTASRTRP